MQYLIDESTITNIADAIRSKTGESSAMTPSQMVSAIEGMSGGGSAVPPYAFNNSTISEYIGSEKYILDYAFASCYSLSTVTFPECNYIGIYAFLSCTQLTTASFPKCSYIGSYAFAFCSNLTTLSFPQCSYIGSHAFDYCSILTSLYLMSKDYVSLVSSNAFDHSPLSARGSGTIYVPSSMLATYKTKSHWSYISYILSGI